MKILSSPAKLMNADPTENIPRKTTPKFIQEADLLQSHLKEKSPDFLRDLMDISAKLADENWARNQNWKAKPGKAESAPALFTFAGEVYRGLDAKTLNADAVAYLQENFRIISGLYGLLKPSDKVMLYRLEMGRNFEFESYKNLYQFWQEKLTDQLNTEMKKGELLLNLASTEYFKVFNEKNLKARVIHFHFYELRSGKPKQIVVYTKHARGLMIRFCAENKLQQLEELKHFNLEKYIFDEALSSENELVFVR